MSTALFVISLFVAIGGCLSLALSQRRHWQAVPSSTSRPPKPLRLVGWTLISLSLVIVIFRDGASFGVLVWPLLIGFASLVTVATLIWIPKFHGFLARWCGSLP